MFAENLASCFVVFLSVSYNIIFKLSHFLTTLDIDGNGAFYQKIPEIIFGKKLENIVAICNNLL